MEKTAALGVETLPVQIPGKKSRVDWHKARKMKALYLLLLIPVAHLFIFSYLPMYGVIIAFKDFRYADGILGSPWNNFDHFKSLLRDPFFMEVFWNTLRISVLRILIEFPAPIVFALLLNELTRMKFKRVVQTISYLPHFMSWVVIAGFVYTLLSPEVGVVNYVLSLFGIEPIYFMTQKSMFIPILLFFELWASIGWGSIIYIAAIAAVDVCLYESASLDGANRLQKAVYITVPSIIPTITILLILSLGSIIRGGFDSIFNLYNGMVMEVADVIDTYTFRKGLYEAKYDYASAVGLFQNVIGLILIVAANMIIKRYNDYGLW